MANTLGVITAILLAVSAFLAMKNRDRYQAEITNTNSEKTKLADTEKKLRNTIAEKESTIKNRKGVEEEIVTLESDKLAQERANAELKTQIEAKTAEIDSNKQKIDEIKEKTKGVGDLKDLARKMKETKEELDTLATNISQAEAKFAGLTAQTKTTEGSVKGLSEKITILTSGRSLPTLRTTIQAIYPSYGFVTLGAGNNAGVVNNSTLNVTRDGATVAKLLVTAVEASRASANIVPDSLAADTALMVGDRVVPEEAPSAPVPAPAATTPAPAPPAAPAAPAAADPFGL